VGTKPETAGREKHAEYEYGDEDSSLDLYEEGLKLALLMESNPDQLEKLKRAVEEIGYRAVLATNTRDAVGKMRFHHFELVVLSDSFDGIDLVQSPVINYLNRLSMSIRRRMFLALVGDGFKTLDEMKAFAMSANAVINRKDLDKTTSILKKAIVDNAKFYKVFMDTLAEVGRA
jgi:CheY-like chemotaxis protein